VAADVTNAPAVAKELCGPPAAADEAPAQLPRGPGLYAWWAPPGMLPGVSGPAHPSVDGLELLYIGLARKSQQVRSRRIAISS